jgi:signal transduction histidine kinase
VPIEADEQVPIYVYISVRDSGPGLHPKDLELLVSGRRSNKAHSTHSFLVPEIPAGLGKDGIAIWVSFIDHKAFRILMRYSEVPD